MPHRRKRESLLDLVGCTARCYDEIPAAPVYEMDSGDRRKLEGTSGAQQGDGMGPPLFSLISTDANHYSTFFRRITNL